MTQPELPALSDRVAAIAEAVLSGSPVADVGTDHGRLPVWLLLTGAVPMALALDRSAAALSGAVKLARAHGLAAPAFQARLGDGLAPLAPGEVATVCLAGMGARLMVRLLGRAPGLGLRRLVCQPNQEPERLRAWSRQTGWALVDERLIRERGFSFPILVFEPDTGPPPDWSEADLRWGPLLRARRDPALIEAITIEHGQLAAAVAAAGPQAPDRLRASLDAATAELDRLLAPA